ncbi:MAG: hypothetical protein AB8B96_00540 [Lysobacterales bacterium]
MSDRANQESQQVQRRRTWLMVGGLAAVAVVIYVTFIASGVMAARG